MAVDVIAQATTRVDIYRDVDASVTSDPDDVDLNEWGDEVQTPRQTDVDPDDDPVVENIPASIIERTRRIPDATGSNLVPVSFHVGRVGSEVDIRSGDRLFDRWYEVWYSVEDVKQPQNPAMVLDKRLELTRVGG